MDSRTKRKLTIVGIAVGSISLILLAGVPIYTMFARRAYHARYIGNYPPLKEIQLGMDKNAVLQILGKPATIRVNEGMAEGFDGTGEFGTKVKEEWIFEPEGWHGHITIYWGADDRVIGVNKGFD